MGGNRSGKLRAFFAVDLGDEARREVEALSKRLAQEPGGDSVRWVRPGGYHVTLRFLGSMPREDVDNLLDCVRRETAACTPFELRLGALGGFPSSRRPRVVVVDLEPAEPLAELAAAVERGAVAAGFPPEERPFHGHATLGRLRRDRRRGPLLDRTCAPVSFRVDSYALYQSELSPKGARYSSLERIHLTQNPQE